MKTFLSLLLFIALLIIAFLLTTDMFSKENCVSADFDQQGSVSKVLSSLSIETDYMQKSDFEKKVIYRVCKLQGTI